MISKSDIEGYYRSSEVIKIDVCYFYANRTLTTFQIFRGILQRSKGDQISLSTNVHKRVLAFISLQSSLSLRLEIQAVYCRAIIFIVCGLLFIPFIFDIKQK